MRSFDFPMSVMFLFFLLLFLLSEFYPGRKRSMAKIRKLFGSQDKQEEFEMDAPNPESAESFSDQQDVPQLNDFESIVLMQFAQNGGKGMFRKQINDALHLESPIFRETLESLVQKGLIRMSLTPLLGIRCYLSEKGRNHLMAQGLLPRILGRTGRPFNP